RECSWLHVKRRLDVQRRRARIHQDPQLDRLLTDQVLKLGIAFPALPVPDELERLEPAKGSRVANLKMLLPDRSQFFAPQGFEISHVLEDRLPFENVDRGQRGGAGPGQPGPG